MHSECISDPVITLFFRHTVAVENIQKLSIASHFKTLDFSFKFCRKGPAFTGIKEDG